MTSDKQVGAPGPERTSRRVPIVAVFGSSEPEWTLPLAEAIGRQLAQRDCIALTGADRKKDPKNAKTVKERAIDGVEAARNAGPYVGPWVGVARDPTPLKPDLDDDGRWIVLHPGFNHKRNYLEAQMCDVAIALQGGEGTESEAVFTLAAGKPVIFVSDDLWPKHLPRDGAPDQTELESLVDRARQAAKKREVPNAYLDMRLERESLVKALEESIGKTRVASPVLYRRVPRATNEADIVKAALDLMMSLPGGEPPRALPLFDGQQNETNDAYDSWLKRLLETIMPRGAR